MLTVSEVCREEGAVIHVGEEGVLVRLFPAVQEKCGACGLCSRNGGSTSVRTLRLPFGGSLAGGARVVVEIRRPNPALASFVLFFLPLILAGGGIIGGVALAPELNLPAWAVASAAGACGLALWVWIVRRVERRWKKKGVLDARIVEVLAAPEGGSDVGT